MLPAPEVFGVWEQLFEITVLKKKTWNINLNSLMFQLLTSQPSEATWELSSQTTQNGQFLSIFLLMCVEFDPTTSAPETFWMSFSCLACKTWLLLVVLDRVRADLSSAAVFPRLRSLPVLIPQCWSLFPWGRNALQLAWSEISYPSPSPSVLSFSYQLAPGICLFTRLLFPGCYTAQGTQCLVGLDFLAGAKEELGSAETNLCIPASFICVMLLLAVLGHELCCGGLSFHRVQTVEIAYTAPTVLAAAVLRVTWPLHMSLVLVVLLEVVVFAVHVAVQAG